MKKVMIAAVILLPLIILMVLLISGTVVGSVQHIYVESIDLRKRARWWLVKDSEEPPQATLSVNVFPRAATNKEVVFSSSDESVVTVDENGVVYGEDFGEAYIYAQSAENGSARIARRVLVTDDVVHEVVFENTVRQLYTGRSAQLTVRVRPQEAVDQSIVWSSSDPSVLAVAADGTVTAKKAGTAEITARSAVNADAFAVLQIECKAPVQSVDIADRSAVTLAERTAVFPQVLFTPAEADEAVAYSVSDRGGRVRGRGGEHPLQKGGQGHRHRNGDGRHREHRVRFKGIHLHGRLLCGTFVRAGYIYVRLYGGRRGRALLRRAAFGCVERSRRRDLFAGRRARIPRPGRSIPSARARAA